MLDLYDGYKWRMREEMTRLAWHAAHIINGTGRRKRAIRPRDLLPPSLREKESITIEQVQRELDEKRARFEAANAKRKQLKLVKSHG